MSKSAGIRRPASSSRPQQGTAFGLSPFLRKSFFSCPFRSKSFFLLLSLLLSSAESFSHPMGNFSVNRWTRLSPRAGGIDVTHVIDLAEIPTQKALSESGSTSAPQGDAFAKLRDAFAARFAPGLVLTVEGARIPLKVVTSSLEFASGVADLPTARLTIELTAEIPKAGESAVAFSDTNFEGRAGWKEIIAVAAKGARILTANVPATDRSRRLSDYPTDPAEPPTEVTTAALRVQFETGVRR